MIESDIGALFALAVVVLVAVRLEARFRLFRSLGAALVGILLAMLLSNLGLIPGESPAYAFLSGPAVSAGIVLILLSVDLRTVIEAGPRMLAAFAVGAIGTIAGAIAAALALSDAIGPETWKLTGQYAATYTGGGANFAAVGAALETSGELFTAGIAADVIVTAIWMATCLAVPALWPGRGGAAAAAAPVTQAEAEAAPDATETGLHRRLYRTIGTVSLGDIAGLLVIVLGTLMCATWLAARTPLPAVLWLTTIALVLAQVRRIRELSGAAVFGNFLVLWFLASNGASSVIANIVAVGPPIFWFAVVTVGVHGVIIFLGGRLVGLDLRTLAVASQANVGGPASAMALASARGYTDRLLPGVAVGLLGYAVGNYIGFAVAALARGMIGG